MYIIGTYFRLALNWNVYIMFAIVKIVFFRKVTHFFHRFISCLLKYPNMKTLSVELIEQMFTF